METKKPKKKININLAIYGAKITGLISVLIIVWCLFFLYNNFVRAISDANVLSVLKKQVALKAVDMELWKKVNNNIEWKKQPLPPNGMDRNPFE
jgi:hypothetical protein